MASERFAPLITVVVCVWVLLPGFSSLSALTVAARFSVSGPGPSARSTTSMLRVPAAPAASVPSAQTTFGATYWQLAPGGVAPTKAAPAGTDTRSTVLSDASVPLFSTRTA